MGRRRKESKLSGDDIKALETFLDSLGYEIFLLGPDRRIIYKNSAAAASFGDGDGRCHTLLKGKKAPCDGCPIEAVLELGYDKRRARLRHTAGWRDYDVLYALIGDRDAGMIALVCMQVPSASRESSSLDAAFIRGAGTLAELEETEEKFRSLVATSEDIVFTLTPDCSVAFLNEAADQLGFPSPDVLGKSIYDFLDEERSRLLRGLIAEVLEGRRQKISDFRSHNRAGRELVFDITFNPVIVRGEITEIAGIARNVTERASTEEALRESEKWYRALVDNSLFAVVVLQEGNVVYMNDVAVAMTGRSRDELKKVSDLTAQLTPEERPRIENIIDRHNSGQAVPTTYDTRLRRPDGSEIVVRVMSNRELTLDGKSAVLMTAADVTDRADTEAAVKASEEKYRTLVETSSDAIAVADRWGNIRFANSTILELTGIEPEEALKYNLYEFVHPDDRKRTAAKFLGEYKEGRGITRYPIRVIARGEDRFFEVSTALLGEASEDADVMIVISDVTARVHSQRKLEESEDRYRTIVEATQDAIITANRAGEILYANQAVKQLMGIEPSKIVGRNVLRHVHPDDRERAAGELMNDFRTGITTANYPIKLVREDGSHFHSEINSGLVGWPSDEAFEIMIIRDVTERYHREQERELHLKTEEALAEIASTFLHLEDTGKAIRSSVEQVARLLDVPQGYYCEISADGLLIERVLEWHDDSVEPVTKHMAGREIASLVEFYDSLRAGKEIVINDIAQLEGLGDWQGPGGIGIRACVSVPVIINEELQGFLAFNMHDEPRDWSHDQVNLVRQLAWTISRALERRRWTEELGRSERFRTRITESVDEGLLVLRNGIFTWANSRAGEIFGRDPMEIIGSGPELLQPSKERLMQISQGVVDLFPRGEDLALNGQVERPDGSVIDVLIWLTMLGSDEGAGEILISVRDVTEAKRMSEQVEAAADAYSTLFSTAGDALIVHSIEGVIANANERATAYTGYPLLELVGMHMKDLGSDRVRELYEDRCDEVLADGSTTFDVRIMRKDGSTMPVEVTSRLTRIWGEDLVISSLRDMTERKKAENETRRRAEQLAFLNEILMAATKSLDIDVVLGAVLDAAITVSGAPSGILVLEEPPGSEHLHVAKSRGITETLVQSMPQAALQRLGALANRGQGAIVVSRQRMIETGTGPDRIEAMNREGIEELLVISLKSGAKFLGLVTLGAPEGFFREDDCDFYSAVGAETGVCIENALIYHELTAEHERLSLLYRSAQNISGQLELGTLLKTTAEEAARAVGAESALIGLVEPGIGDFVWGAAYNVDLTALKNVRLPISEGIGGHIMKTKRAHRWTIDRFNDDPVARALDIRSGVALPLISGDMVMGVLEVHCADRELVVSEEDIQLLEAMGRQAGVAIENSRLYEETRGHMAALQKANAELLSLDRMKSDFVSTVSHELRSPLAVIEGFAKTLVEHFDRIDRDTERESIEIILKKAIALEGLIENILDMSRIEEGRLEVMPRRFDIIGLAEKVRSDQEIVAESSRVEVRKQHDELFVLADPEKTEVVLSNLVGNAIKFSPDGGTVVIAPNKSDGVVRVSVTDEGIGIPAKEQERIFDRFYQVERGETRSFQGAGLGLYITRELLKTMGGRIIVESRVGFGTTFTFTLPTA